MILKEPTIGPKQEMNTALQCRNQWDIFSTFPKFKSSWVIQNNSLSFVYKTKSSASPEFRSWSYRGGNTPECHHPCSICYPWLVSLLCKVAKRSMTVRYINSEHEAICRVISLPFLSSSLSCLLEAIGIHAVSFSFFRTAWDMHIFHQLIGPYLQMISISINIISWNCIYMHLSKKYRQLLCFYNCVGGGIVWKLAIWNNDGGMLNEELKERCA